MPEGRDGRGGRGSLLLLVDDYSVLMEYTQSIPDGLRKEARDANVGAYSGRVVPGRRNPLTPFHRRLVFTVGLGWMFDALDLGLISFVLVGLARDWGLGIADTFAGVRWLPASGLILSAGLLGMAVGGSLGGILADRYGRRPIFQATLLLYSLATGLCALVPGPALLGRSGSVALLAVLRFVVGLGLGAEFPAATALVSEWASTRQRGRMLALVESFWPLGGVLAAIIGLGLIAGEAGNWRWACAVGALPALYVVHLRRHLPESPRYLALIGQEAAARAALAAGAPGDPEIARATAPTLAPSPRLLLARPWARRTLLLWGLWAGGLFGFYGISGWLPTLLGQQRPLAASFGDLALINLVSLFGTPVTAWLLPRWGRRPTLIAGLLGAALGAGLFWLPLGGPGDPGLGQGWLLGCGVLIGFCARMVGGASYTYSAELYPTPLRGWGLGVAAAWGRLGAASGPYVAALWLSTPTLGGNAGLFALYAGIFGLCALGVGLFGEETRDRVLEEIPQSRD